MSLLVQGPAVFREARSMVSAAYRRFTQGDRLPRLYGLNPTQLTVDQLHKPIVVFAHGDGDTAWAWVKHAERLQETGVAAFTVASQSEAVFRESLEEIVAFCRSEGISGDVPLILVGHSLGAIRHYSLLMDGLVGARVEQLIAIAARSKDNTRWLRFMFEELVPELDRIDRGFLDQPELLRRVRTVVADQDWLLNREAATRGSSVLVQGVSHLSVKDAPETLEAVHGWISEQIRLTARRLAA